MSAKRCRHPDPYMLAVTAARRTYGQKIAEEFARIERRPPRWLTRPARPEEDTRESLAPPGYRLPELPRVSGVDAVILSTLRASQRPLTIEEIIAATKGATAHVRSKGTARAALQRLATLRVIAVSRDRFRTTSDSVEAKL